MSNHLAIATVTTALKTLVSKYAIEAVPSAHVSTSNPRTLGSGTLVRGVNIYLYLVTPNPTLRNDHVPTRRPNGSLLAVPRVAMDLHYLFTFYGDEDRLEPQLLLGSVAATLNRIPILTPSLIREAIDSHPSLLHGSNLDQQESQLTVTPSRLDAETLSKMWSVLYQVPYLLSVAYECGPVLVDSDVVATANRLVEKVVPSPKPKAS
ncbi:DUF4255 domain-containing protein [Corallococcus aberystwythensis]|uniref:DUF4255 domain-containing protein n=1 Tax=Corallococcus aberystwythensis TaxID=2316722 RepID=A0A3A8PTX5_9BACT|nr:DUF4255 domain-containing protein [Corallococcus aberystwythensis]RKH54934.1 DUF4255 domain-containing protein [Corallococcus aberystwythensis]